MLWPRAFFTDLSDFNDAEAVNCISPTTVLQGVVPAYSGNGILPPSTQHNLVIFLIRCTIIKTLPASVLVPTHRPVLQISIIRCGIGDHLYKERRLFGLSPKIRLFSRFCAGTAYSLFAANLQIYGAVRAGRPPQPPMTTCAAWA